MEFIVPGLCGLLVIFGLVAVIMSRSNWRIPQMVLMSFILIFSLVFFYLAARTLRTHENWGKEIAKYDESIKELHDGKGDQPGITQLTEDRAQRKHEVVEVMAERGRVWPNAIKDRADQATGAITASFDQQLRGLEAKSVVFVFEQDKGSYLGEFTVIDANDKQAKLIPSSALSSQEYVRIGRSKGPWVFYEMMPADSHELFADSDPTALTTLKTLMPDSSLDEYLRDGKPAKADDPLDRVQVRDSDKAKIYVRPLRDYAQSFREAHRERNQMIAQNAEISAQLQQVSAANTQVEEDIKAAQTEKEGLAKDFVKFKSELAKVVAFNDALQAKKSEINAKCSELFKSNLRLSAQLTDIEKKLGEASSRKAPPAEASASLGR